LTDLQTRRAGLSASAELLVLSASADILSYRRKIGVVLQKATLQ